MSDQFILFTMMNCGNCTSLKSNSQIKEWINTGAIKTYDVTKLDPTSSLWKLFLQVSPNRQIPALAVLESNRLVDSNVGLQNILSMLVPNQY
jgi:hypothetical protein